MEKLAVENKKLKEEIEKLKKEAKELRVENELLLPYKIRHEKRLKTKETIYFDEPLVIDDESHEELTFRRPKGRDVASVMLIEHPSERIHQMARLLCPVLNTMDDDEFYDLDYERHYKHIGNAIEGFM